MPADTSSAAPFGVPPDSVRVVDPPPPDPADVDEAPSAGTPGEAGSAATDGAAPALEVSETPALAEESPSPATKSVAGEGDSGGSAESVTADAAVPAEETTAGTVASPAGDKDGAPAESVPSTGDAAGTTGGDPGDLEAEPASAGFPTWSVDTVADGSTAFAFNLAKIPGQGEDADPLLGVSPDLTVVGVFDGMGGAGGTTYPTPDGPRTGAYLASRIVRDVVRRVVAELLEADWQWDGARAAKTVHDAVDESLKAALVELKAPRSGLRSSLIRALPTTMALAVAQRRSAGSPEWDCHLLWAGDSRIYLLDPEAGMAQLTVDDIRDRGDAMANLRDDSVMSNAISADAPFAVRTAEVALTEPFVLIGATDGCFGYVPTPMHVEHLMLSSQRDSADSQEWRDMVERRVAEVTGDDAAMALAVRGADHAELQILANARLCLLENEWVRPLDVLAVDLRRAQTEVEILSNDHTAMTAALWASYKQDYERHFPRPGTENR